MVALGSNGPLALSFMLINTVDYDGLVDPCPVAAHEQ